MLASGVDAAGETWPNAKYRDQPVAFFRDVLGVEPWSRQIEAIEAVRDHKRVAISSGHKVSKSHTAAGIALWFYCSFDDARVVLTSTTSRQVDQILWRELRMMHARSGRCVACKTSDPRGPTPCEHSRALDGEPAQLARSGLKSTDFREIVGFTAREAEAVAGVSGKNLLYLVDEASGVDDEIFEAIEGNRAGGARIVLFSNPTRTEGEFYRAFDDKAAFYKTLRISSEETPNVVEGREVVPGLAGREWIEEKRREWGVDSPLYKVRVKGEHVKNEDGKILSIHAIAEAEGRWLDTAAVGRLHLGLDPAGPGDAGDEIVMAPRRGAKLLELLAWRGLTEEAIVVHTVDALAKHRVARDPLPLVTVDREGPIGSRVFGLLRAYADTHPGSFEVLGVRSSDRAVRKPQIYDLVRDELWANLAEWLRSSDLGGGSGAIPEDTRLAKELHAPSWQGQLNGRIKCTAKRDIRKMIGRSPDRADAVALAVWETPSTRLAARGDDDTAHAPAAHARDDDYADSPDPDRTFDPYGGIG